MSIAVNPDYFPVGIDIGTDEAYISVTRKNNLFDGRISIEILLDNYSRRPIPNAWYTHNGMRDIGVLSTNFLKNNIFSSVYYYYQFIGKTASCLKQGDSLLYPFLDKGCGKEELRVSLASNNAKGIYLEHCLAMMMDHCNSLVMKTASVPPLYVFAIPSYATSSFRNNFILSMRISSIKEHDTLHSQLAAALDYVYYRNGNHDFSSYSADSPFVLVLVNSGFHATECSCFHVWENHIELAGFSYREFCGGDRVTWIVLSIIREKYEQDCGRYPVENPRLFFELYCIADKAKRDIFLQNITDVDIEVYGDSDDPCLVNLLREEVEQRIQKDGVDKDITAAFMECIRESGCKEINRCEMVGGNSRIPLFKEKIQAELNVQRIPCTFTATMNCDECVATGCGLYAAYKTDPDRCPQKELMSCIDAMNVDYKPKNGEDPFYRQPETIIEEALKTENVLSSLHRDYQMVSSLHNEADGSYFRLKQYIEDKNPSPKVKEEIEDFIEKARKLQVWNSSEKSVLYGKWLKSFMDYLSNKLNDLSEQLTLFSVENGTQRFVVEGTYQHGELNGQGSFFDIDPGQDIVRYYSGQWKSSKWEGEGLCVEKNAIGISRWEGVFHECELWNGKRIDELESGVMIVTPVQNGFKKESSVYDDQKRLLYVGGLKNFKKNGWGIEYYPQERVASYKGNFVNGKREGHGCCYDRSGKPKYIGEWKNNKYYGKGTE